MRFGLTAILLLLQACPQAPGGTPDAGALSDGSVGPCNDCPAQTQCVDEQCVPDCGCPEGQSCDDEGQCHPSCAGDGDCSEGMICEAGLCLPGCAGDEACAEAEICESSRCVAAQCTSLTDCEAGQWCESRRCLERGEVPCESAEDCGRDWRCSSHGLCFAGDCLVHGDCDTSERCFQSRCLPRTMPELGIVFERHYVSPITDHLGRIPEGDGIRPWPRDRSAHGYGLGGGLFDMDGDLDLDLFLGRRQRGEERADESPACVYENVSLPGALRFQVVESHCGLEMGKATSAYGVDVEGDGFHELVVLGAGIIQLWRFHPEPEIVDLASQLAEEDPRRACEAGAMASMDLDLDGRPDLVVGCQAPNRFEEVNEDHLLVPQYGNEAAHYDRVHVGVIRNIAFVQDESGGFRLVDDPALIDRRDDDYGLEDDGSALGLGQIDVDGDGLLDLLVANDTLVWPFDGIQGSTAPGAVYFRCDPSEDCTWRWQGLGRGIRAYGNYMGLGNLHIEGRGDYIYVSDVGANLCTRYEDREPLVDVSEQYRISMDATPSHDLFSWGVVVEDFDRDGRDDLYISNGPPPHAFPPSVRSFSGHYDGLILQQAPGSFLGLVPEEVGLARPSLEDSAGSQWVFSSRAAVKADLDNDGFLELLTLPMEGHLRIQAEVPTTADVPPRCTLVPQPRYVPAYGFGYAVAGPTGDDWRRRDMQGQMRFGASPFVLSTLNQGRLRFPSGAEVDFDCDGGPGPLVVEEPEWIRLIYREDLVKVRLIAPWTEPNLPQLHIVFDGPGGRRAFQGFHDGIGWDLQPQADETRFMLRLNDRWIGRWFATR